MATAAGVLGLSPGFKFDPADEELVEHYLVARLLHQPVPFDGVIIDDDPRSAPPWTLLGKHGRREEEAFFFAEGQAVNGKAGSRHKKRTCTGGGCWQGQRLSVDGEKLCVGGVEIGWKKYLLSFHVAGDKKSSGWVMHEYAVTSPADMAASSMRLYRIRRTEHGAKKRKIRDQSGSDGDVGAARAAARMRATETEAEPVDDLLQEHHYPSSAPSRSASRPGDIVDADVVLPDSSCPGFQFQPTAEIEAYDSARPLAPATFSSDQETPAGVADELPGTASGGGAAPADWTTTMDDGVFLDFEIPENIDLNCFFTLPDDEYFDPCGGLQAADGSGCQWS